MHFDYRTPMRSCQALVCAGVLLACHPREASPPTLVPVAPPLVHVKGLDLACRTGVAGLSVGWSHACAVCKDTAVACWGYNYKGNLGVPMPTERAWARTIPRLRRAVEVAAGSNHTCARLNTGQVTCWGSNSEGQLGDDTSATRIYPVMVTELADADQLDVSLGPGHACATTKARTLRCWGVNFNNQLGDGSMQHRPAPIAVSNLNEVAQVSTGAYHTCARNHRGQVWCWGGRHGRQNFLSIPTPRLVEGLDDAIDVQAGGEHTCALRKIGRVVCWGMNGVGQLGNGTWDDSYAPTEVVGLANVIQLSTASNHTCVLRADGVVSCWGANEHGQLQDGTKLARNAPRPVAGLVDVLSISTGHRNSCALTSKDEIVCWGEVL